MTTEHIYNDDYKGYFHTFFTCHDDIDGLTTISDKHLHYTPQSYVDDPIVSRIQRSSYVNNVNGWLEMPLYPKPQYGEENENRYDEDRYDHCVDGEYDKDNNGSDDDDEYTQYAKYEECMLRMSEDGESGEASEDGEAGEDGEDGEKENLAKNEEPKHMPTKRSVVKKMHDLANEILSTNGFEVDDCKQFKEDFIHFIYTLSSLKHES